MSYKCHKNTWKRKKIKERAINIGGEIYTEVDPEKYRHYLYPRDDVDYTIYSHNDCKFSIQALEALNKARGKNGRFIKYRNFDYMICWMDPKFSSDIAKMTKNYPTIPIIFKRKKFLGGTKELLKDLKMDIKIKDQTGGKKADLKEAWKTLRATQWEQ